MAKNMYEKLGFSEEELAKAGLPTAAEVNANYEAQEAIRTQEVAFKAQETIEAARTSLDFLAAMAMPEVFEYCYPPVFLGVWQWLLHYVFLTRDFSKLALGLPRGFGKTTLIKIFILYCILFTKKKFILVICTSAGMAENIIADVVDMLNEPNIINTFGDWKLGIEKDTQPVKKFGFRGRNIILAGLGAEGSLRGLNLKHARPDVMIFEDVQSRECADSELQSDSLERWMQGTAMKAKSPHGCLYVFVGNMYPTKNSILRKLKKNPNWIKFIAGGILADGTSLWEELQPIEQLKDEFRNDLAMGRPEIFYAEVLNDENASANNLIDLSSLLDYPYSNEEIPAGNFVIIDPATGKKNSDDVAIGYCEVIAGTPVLRGLKADKFSPVDCIREALQFCLTNNCRLVAIESVAYQSTLKFWFEYVCQQMGIIGIECVEIYPGGLSKNTRILQMLKNYAAHEFYIHPDVRALAHLQISQFNPMRIDNTDDILDLLWYMPKVIELYGQQVLNQGVILDQEFRATEVWEDNAAF